MASRKSILGLGLCVTLAYAGLDWVEQHEVVTLHTQSGTRAHYARLFVVDDPPSTWIRAERPDRLWLASLREQPEVILSRGGRDGHYHAEVWEGGSHERMDRLFREKYGVLDRMLGWLMRRDPVLIRLDRT